MMMLQKYQFELRDCSHIFSCHASHIAAMSCIVELP
jgi:hypothetical protein